ncbi:hypothetical protein CIK05_00270 [Bdellovibrio sp. qaytius]|nr:hypothetical protein CIK05_00270 [Bdellovibrio sp. qaytius]
MQPQLILLNGTTSAGKSSIVKCLQQKLQSPYLDMGLDKFLYMLPEHYLKQPLWEEVWGHARCKGELGNRLMSGMHNSIRTMINSGNLVIADHVLIEKNWVSELAELFHDQPAYFIGVHCPLDVAEKREADRKDRTLGSARLQYSVVHQWAHYDFTVDSSTMAPEKSAEKIIEFLASQTSPIGFAKTREQLKNI